MSKTRNLLRSVFAILVLGAVGLGLPANADHKPNHKPGGRGGGEDPPGPACAQDVPASCVPAIVYNRAGNIEVADIDGANVSTVTLGGREPSWSPDGTNIVFAEGDGIWVQQIDRETSSPDGLPYRIWESTPSQFVTFDPHWNPVFDYIAFSANPATANENDIFFVDPDGSNPTMFTQTDGIVVVRPTFSPDGNKLAAVEWEGGSYNIVVYDLLNPGFKKDLTRGHALEGLDGIFGFTWAKNRNALVFKSYGDASGLEAIWCIDPDFPDDPVLLTLETRIWSPSFSSDDSELFYVKEDPSHKGNNRSDRKLFKASLDYTGSTNACPAPLLGDTLVLSSPDKRPINDPDVAR